MRGLSYSRFIYGLTLADIKLNRKVLSEMAIHSPEVFDEVTELVREGLKKAPPLPKKQVAEAPQKAAKV